MSEQLETIEAIPTTLNGISFRSRLEAKWSIFLTSLSIPWHYERSSVRVHHRTRWPDFWCPTLGSWVEIKPAGTPPDTDLAQDVAEVTTSAFLWVAGPPKAGGYQVTLFRCGLPPEFALRFAVGRRDHSELWLCSIESGTAVCLSARSARANWPVADCEMLREASRQAMQHRFTEETP